MLKQLSAGFSIVFLFLGMNYGYSNDSLKTGSVESVNNTRKKMVLFSVAGASTVSLVALNELWYKQYPRSAFHFFNDNAAWLQMDKAGHALTAYSLGRAGMRAMKLAGSEEKEAAWTGAGMSLCFLTAIEMLDGFSEEWGFSYGDQLANIGGVAMLVSQQMAWQEQRILLKYSFTPSPYAVYRPELLGTTRMEQTLKDYNGQTYWLSFNPKSFLPHLDFLPSWLNFAFGYSGGGMLGGSHNPSFNLAEESLPDLQRYRQYFFSLDVDLTRIKTRSKFANTLFYAVGFIKIPFPALEYNDKQGFRFRPFYF